MSERDGFQSGVPCWVDTWQPDADAAAGFYSGLFGWETVGPRGGPFMCRQRGRDVAFIGERPGEHAHVPVAWMTYLWSDSADETAASVTKAGGRILFEPFDSLDGGRIVVRRSRGRRARGLAAGGAPRRRDRQRAGSLELGAALHERSRGLEGVFYVSVFGWETDTFGVGPNAPTMWRVPGYFGGQPQQPVSRDVVAGMARLQDDGTPWQIDFWVDDVDATVARAEELGGRMLVPAYDTSIARRAVLSDPQGAEFSVSRITIGHEG